MKKKWLVVLIVSVVIMIGVYLYLTNVTFEDPKTCTSCHYMLPYYQHWKTSTHNTVPCLKCHDYTPERALAGQFLFLARAYNPRPLTNVPDKNCLRSGCHDKRLVESKVAFTKRGITFDHKPHFTEMKRGIRLHCRSCHADIVQGEHIKVSMNSCYLCHFKGVPHDQAVNGCPSCHAAPQSPMANFILEDEEGFVDVIAFPDVYKKFSALIVKDSSILVKGSLELSEKGTKIHAREILPLDTAFDSDAVSVELRIPANSSRTSLIEAKKIAEDHSGKCPLYVKLTVQGCEALIATRMSLSVNRDVISSFENVFGKNTVRIDYHESVP